MKTAREGKDYEEGVNSSEVNLVFWERPMYEDSRDALMETLREDFEGF